MPFTVLSPLKYIALDYPSVTRAQTPYRDLGEVSDIIDCSDSSEQFWPRLSLAWNCDDLTHVERSSPSDLFLLIASRLQGFEYPPAHVKSGKVR